MVLCTDLTRLASGGILFGKNMVGLSSATMAFQTLGATVSISLVGDEVRTGLGGLKAPFVEKVDVRLDAGSLVLGVGNQLDALQTLQRRHDEGIL